MAKSVYYEDKNPREIKALETFLHSHMREYEAGEMVDILTNNHYILGVVEEGCIFFVDSKEDEKREILDYYDKDCVIRSYDNTAAKSESSYLIAKTKCRIRTYEYSGFHLSKPADVNRVVPFIYRLLQEAAVRSQLHVRILSGRTIQDKLETYFTALSNRQGRTTIELPISLTDLADYLCVDRSAMMRSLQGMKNKSRIVVENHLYRLSYMEEESNEAVR